MSYKGPKWSGPLPPLWSHELVLPITTLSLLSSHACFLAVSQIQKASSSLRSLALTTFSALDIYMACCLTFLESPSNIILNSHIKHKPIPPFILLALLLSEERQQSNFKDPKDQTAWVLIPAEAPASSICGNWDKWFNSSKRSFVIYNMETEIMPTSYSYHED